MSRIFGAPILTKRKISIFRSPPVCVLRTGRKGELLKMPGASHRWVKKPALESRKGNFSGRTI
ncbi:MAG: hypothetical protein CO106_07920 [Deltaproteobacteria bacterium CG_4_9_14_3_um_filter_44_9]|nr:MAG: hypothetical protein COZ68_09975 [Deltaproteobacteria bacterium CG_4_8_14_3_um_filter_43_13]PJB40667.1 MAG: hypothetical protein CO106_07920 [Deltaproteobacteria bacterium CG_4_9_14_3_um_filter_44_9]